MQHTMIPAPTMVTSAVFCATAGVDNSLEAPRSTIFKGKNGKERRATPVLCSVTKVRLAVVSRGQITQPRMFLNANNKMRGMISVVAFVAIASFFCASASDLELNQPWPCKNDSGRKGEEEEMPITKDLDPLQVRFGAPPLLLHCRVLNGPCR